MKNFLNKEANCIVYLEITYIKHQKIGLLDYNK